MRETQRRIDRLLRGSSKEHEQRSMGDRMIDQTTIRETKNRKILIDE